MIDAAANALETGKIDSYSVEYENGGYRVNIARGSKTGTGFEHTEEKALELAIEDSKMSAAARKATEAAEASEAAENA